ncbi:unnamed protein product [Victoria cruziana]
MSKKNELGFVAVLATVCRSANAWRHLSIPNCFHFSSLCIASITVSWNPNFPWKHCLFPPRTAIFTVDSNECLGFYSKQLEAKLLEISSLTRKCFRSGVVAITAHTMERLKEPQQDERTTQPFSRLLLKSEAID